MENLNPFWPTVQKMEGLCAVAAEWRDGMGSCFETCNTLFRLFPGQAKIVPCPKNCGCRHKVVDCPGDKILAVRRFDAERCDILELKPEDLELWELDVPKLGREVCKAFGCQSKPEDVGMQCTSQIGTWSADAV